MSITEMSVETRTLIAIAVLGIIDAIVPGLPILALVLAYVVVEKPAWFASLYHQKFGRPGPS